MPDVKNISTLQGLFLLLIVLVFLTMMVMTTINMSMSADILGALEGPGEAPTEAATTDG